MPRRSNIGNEAQVRRAERNSVVRNNPRLYQAILNTKRLLARNNVSYLARLYSRHKLINKAILVFERVGKLHALPQGNPKMIEKLFESQEAVNRERHAQRNRSINRINVPSFRNASVTKNKNGNPMVVYFPNSTNN
jgi:hypothetical protein